MVFASYIKVRVRFRVWVRVRVRALQYSISPMLWCKSDWDLKGLKNVLLLFFLFFCASHQTRATLLYTIIFNIHEKESWVLFTNQFSGIVPSKVQLLKKMTNEASSNSSLWMETESWIFSGVDVCFVHSVGRKEAWELHTMHKGIL